MPDSASYRRVAVELGERRYDIDIGSGLLRTFDIQALARGRDVLIVSDSNVAPHYLPSLLARFQEVGDKRVAHIVVPAGEANKSLAQAERVFAALADMQANRDVTIFALGGGVIGDLSGFVAASWMRGVRFVQIPTTLLAMVDSSVGGKTAVNLPQGKNLIGAFWQPAAVIIDLDVLTSLPAREYFSGLAEVLKYGAIADADFFAWLESHADALARREPDTLLHAIERSCAHKAAIVIRDERETGERAFLNFGHTFGHALEAATNYQTLLHGEAIAIGMVCAAQLSAKRGNINSELVVRLCALLQRWQLPTTLSEPMLDARRPDASQLLELMRLDKKNSSGQIRLILLDALGQASIKHAGDEEILATWNMASPFPDQLPASHKNDAVQAQAHHT